MLKLVDVKTGNPEQNLKEDLAHYKKKIEQIPLAIQYNKMDLLEKGIPLSPIEMLEKDLNRNPETPSFEASAQMGTNVLATLKKIIITTVASINKDLNNMEIKQNRRLKSETANYMR